jgi:hypothetical protein
MGKRKPLLIDPPTFGEWKLLLRFPPPDPNTAQCVRLRKLWEYFAGHVVQHCKRRYNGAYPMGYVQWCDFCKMVAPLRLRVDLEERDHDRIAIAPATVRPLDTIPSSGFLFSRLPQGGPIGRGG